LYDGGINFEIFQLDPPQTLGSVPVKLHFHNPGKTPKLQQGMALVHENLTKEA
jgi:hypothetical protein